MNLFRYALIITILLQVNGCSNTGKNPPQAIKGVLDLRNRDFSTSGPVELNGEWEFYWQKFRDEISPGDKPGYIMVPSPWNDYIHDGKKIGADGFAAYKLKILLPETNGRLAIKYTGTYGGSRLYINNEIYSQGSPGKNIDTTIPVHYNNIIPLEKGTETDIVLDAANYYHRAGGIKTSFVIDNEIKIKNTVERKRLSEAMYAAVYLVLAVIPLIFFILTKNRMVLFFALFSLDLSARIFMVGEQNIHILFPDMDFRTELFIEYMTFYLSVATLAPFIHLLLPQYFTRTIRNIFLANSAVFIALTIVLPSSVYSKMIYLYQAAAVLFLITSLVSISRAIINKVPTARMQMASFLFLSAGAVLDIIFSIFDNYSSNFTAVGMLVFVLFNGIILSRHLYNNRLEKELSEKKMLHDNFQMKLLEIEKNLIQDDLLKSIEIQKELEVANSTKNRFFSVISHDLRGPIGTIKEILEMLNNDVTEYQNMTTGQKKEFCAMLAAISEQSAITYDLLENLLDWALDQQNMVVYQPGKHSIDELIIPAVTLLRIQASAKNISININNADRDLSVNSDLRTSHTIIRNLLSNAVKFSYNNSEINIYVNSSGQYVNISIQDHGSGIPADKVAELNNKQTLLSSPGTNNEKGTGLGLPLVFEYIRGNQGKIHVESSKGKGTTFTVSFPGSDVSQSMTARNTV